jgi:hypothetical protein
MARAIVTTGEERDRLLRLIAPGGASYADNTARVFPVVLDGVPAPRILTRS